MLSSQCVMSLACISDHLADAFNCYLSQLLPASISAHFPCAQRVGRTCCVVMRDIEMPAESSPLALLILAASDTGNLPL